MNDGPAQCRVKAKVVQNKARIDSARPLQPKLHKRQLCGEDCRKQWHLRRNREKYAAKRRSMAAA